VHSRDQLLVELLLVAEQAVPGGYQAGGGVTGIIGGYSAHRLDHPTVPVWSTTLKLKRPGNQLRASARLADVIPASHGLLHRELRRLGLGVVSAGLTRPPLNSWGAGCRPCTCHRELHDTLGDTGSGGC